MWQGSGGGRGFYRAPGADTQPLCSLTTRVLGEESRVLIAMHLLSISKQSVVSDGIDVYATHIRVGRDGGYAFARRDTAAFTLHA
jgi:hypothetical protein